MVARQEIIKFGELGSTFGTRQMGQETRMKVEKALSENSLVIFDFSNVRNISNSFADECFGVLSEKHGIQALKEKTTFTNVSSVVALVIKDAIATRTSPK